MLSINPICQNASRMVITDRNLFTPHSHHVVTGKCDLMQNIAFLGNGTFYSISRDINPPIKLSEFNGVLFITYLLRPRETVSFVALKPPLLPEAKLRATTSRRDKNINLPKRI